MMKTNEIRSKFLEYFENKSHKIVSSASLIPEKDPTLMFTSAGMVQFKDFFAAKSTDNLPYTRAVSSQKCLRAGGKDSDLENVGRTPRHHTYFEMLGNFSFGDYFKEEAIKWSYEFIVKKLKIDADRLWASVYKDDDEAFEIWEKYLPEERIVRLGEKDNYWGPPGETGPCGPCSELHYDLGKDMGCGKEDCKPGCDCDRFLEIWNLVFTQFHMDREGNLTLLEKKNIDTGMGLERIASVLQGVTNNYYIDIFRELIEDAEKILNVKYKKKNEEHFHIIADHVRAITFAISDGVIPSNDGRGYVIRRILRRALRQAKILGFSKPFLYKLSQTVVKQFKHVYPKLKEAQQHTQNLIKMEEESFLKTLGKGLDILEGKISDINEKNKKEIDGETAFKLYDTYGFPLELTIEIAQEKGIKVDKKGFEKEMEKQRKRGKESWKGSKEDKRYNYLFENKIPETKFLGYDKNEAKAKLLYVKERESNLEMIFDRSPFYGEAGGQIGDKGKIYSEDFEFSVNDTQKVNNIIVHIGNVQKGDFSIEKTYSLKVDKKRRKAIARNHTATHLLHKVLKEILGEHVNQSGSLVADDRLRFDFTHFAKVKNEELLDIERRINEKIIENLKVSTEKKDIKKAKKEGATALFSERYDKEVRVVSTENFSKELCGGTHVSYTGEIGFFKITDESSLAAGVRRIEAVTGMGAFEKIKKYDNILIQLNLLFKSETKDLVEKAKKILEENKNKQKQIEKLKMKKATNSVKELLENKINVNGIEIVKDHVDLEDANVIRELAQKVKDRAKNNTAIVLIGSSSNKSIGIVMLTDDLTENYHAGKIANRIANKLNGGGGGRPDMAQFGGSRTDNIDEIIENLNNFID
ncbi:MAG: alanine--tRNA ligase [Candidatus Mcinerneyibacterium aminivorans]|uniref:Alanine--tRNA ligase n=1 Tax=Candidatus Mcinerneyibacterium aminivorans TaxID=2703815 RepID=A0A5D0MFX0_9BACT|nr:MAG: alanine--tRNA ligase [Candidatus Mcinerneyibacterium aminivorans]